MSLARPAYLLISSQTTSTTTSFVSFENVPQGFRDLILVCDTAITSGTGFMLLQFNSDATSGIYTIVTMAGNGSSTNTQAVTLGSELYTSYSYATLSTARSQVISNLMDYSSNKQKTVIMRSNNASIMSEAAFGRYASTSAITNIRVRASGDNFASGSTFSLYGVLS